MHSPAYIHRCALMYAHTCTIITFLSHEIHIQQNTIKMYQVMRSISSLWCNCVEGQDGVDDQQQVVLLTSLNFDLLHQKQLLQRQPAVFHQVSVVSLVSHQKVDVVQDQGAYSRKVHKFSQRVISKILWAKYFVSWAKFS